MKKLKVEIASDDDDEVIDSKPFNSKAAIVRQNTMTPGP